MFSQMIAWGMSTPGHSLGKKNKVAQNEKQKELHGFLYSKNMANFEVFR